MTESRTLIIEREATFIASYQDTFTFENFEIMMKEMKIISHELADIKMKIK